MNATIGVDVGATTISGGLVTGAGEILHDIQLPTRQPYIPVERRGKASGEDVIFIGPD